MTGALSFLSQREEGREQTLVYLFVRIWQVKQESGLEVIDYISAIHNILK